MFWVQALQRASCHSRSLKGNLVQIEDGPAAVTLTAGTLRVRTEPIQPKTPLHGNMGAGRPLEREGSQKTCLSDDRVSVDRELFSDRPVFF